MKKLNKKGFTIVELVIVIAVIGILSAVLIPTFSNLTDKANQSAAEQAASNEYKEWLVEYADNEAVSLKDHYFEVEQNGKFYYFQFNGSKLEYKGVESSAAQNLTEKYGTIGDAKVKIYTGTYTPSTPTA